MQVKGQATAWRVSVTLAATLAFAPSWYLLAVYVNGPGPRPPDLSDVEWAARMSAGRADLLQVAMLLWLVHALVTALGVRRWSAIQWRSTIFASSTTGVLVHVLIAIARAIDRSGLAVFALVLVASTVGAFEATFRFARRRTGPG